METEYSQGWDIGFPATEPWVQQLKASSNLEVSLAFHVTGREQTFRFVSVGRPEAPCPEAPCLSDREVRVGCLAQLLGQLHCGRGPLHPRWHLLAPVPHPHTPLATIFCYWSKVPIPRPWEEQRGPGTEQGAAPRLIPDLSIL